MLNKDDVFLKTGFVQWGGADVRNGVENTCIHMAGNKWVTGVMTPINGVITLLIAGRGPLCGTENDLGFPVPLERLEINPK